MSVAVYKKVQDSLLRAPQHWVITGVAGFIGSNLLETLLRLGQNVTGLDNFSTGKERNLMEVQARVEADCWKKFRFVEGDIRNLSDCRAACVGADVVLHQAALGSVPRSIEDPIATNQSNIDGFLNVLVSVRDAGVRRLVYAASSSTYGDHQGLPKVEETIGKPLSPYAVTKLVNELYADVFHRSYGLDSIGLRYFNVFGPRQDPDGAYAAVIPRWTANMICGEPVFINGDGETSRDFCFVDNAVQANLLAATTPEKAAINQVYNVAFGERTSLSKLFEMIKKELSNRHSLSIDAVANYRDFRAGDVRHSLADIDKAKRLLGYAPTHNVAQGLSSSMGWYLDSLSPDR